jgi:tetratricopeptide (TPR) repeat protein
MTTSDIAELLSQAQAALRQPILARVVGERVRVLSAEYAGERRGLVARVERKGVTHAISLADLEVDAAAPLRRVIEAYRAMLGVDGPAEEPADGRRPPELSAGERVEVVICSVKKTAARCRLAGGTAMFTLRCSGAAGLVPGEIVTVRVEKAWQHAGHPYVSGEVEGSRLEVERLGLAPLRLEPHGDWDPAEEYWGEDGVIPEWATAIVARGPRPAFEMEQVIPGADPTNWDSDPIVEAAELREAGDFAGARALLMEQLAGDLRCLDAHAHLGNQEFDHSPRQATRHYEAGVRIGELSFGARFEGVLPWGLVDNRPFLRCLHGYGLCLWRLGRREEAIRVFERMLWLNPSDNQGARFLLEDARRGLSWEEQQREEEKRANPCAGRRPAAGSVEVDLQELMFALEDRSPGNVWYIDRKTGDLHCASEDLPDEELPVPREELEDDTRFVPVESEETGRAFRDMEEFTETVRQPALRQRLRDALAGKGAFGRFKRVLADHPAERERWFRVRDERLEARAREWLDDIGMKAKRRA